MDRTKGRRIKMDDDDYELRVCDGCLLDFESPTRDMQNLCMSCLKKQYALQHKTVRHFKAGETISALIPGPPLTTLDNKEERQWFIKRLKEIRGNRGIPVNIPWEFSLTKYEMLQEEGFIKRRNGYLPC